MFFVNLNTFFSSFGRVEIFFGLSAYNTADVFTFCFCSDVFTFCSLIVSGDLLLVVC